MKKLKSKQLNRDIRRSITGSLGRFLSIFSLMALGVFAFVGLKVSGPNMRATAQDFYSKHHLADLTVTSTLGLDKSDQKIISQEKGVKTAEFGYFQDALVKHSTRALRVFSLPKKLSTYQVMQGKLPGKSDEIALDYLLADKYKLGQTIDFKESSKTVLKHENFKIVGFVKSSEYVDKQDFGQTNIGTGQLNGYAITTDSAFDRSVRMIARVTYDKMQNLSPYDKKYKAFSSSYQKKLQKAFKAQPAKRLQALKAVPQAKIKSGTSQIESALGQLNQQESTLDKQAQQLKMAQAAGYPVAASQASQIQAGKAKIAETKQDLQAQLKNLQAEQAKLDKLSAPVYTVSDRASSDPGYQAFIDNSTRIDTLSNIFPVVLFAIAALVSLTTMTRFVEEERSNLGLLKALGYTNSQIRRKFVIYGLVSSFEGTLVGTLLGHWVLPNVVFKAYTASSTFSGLILTFSLKWTVVAFLIALLCAVAPAYWTSLEVLKEVPASLFLAKAPKAGSRILLERISFIWKRLSFTYKVTARNLFRYKKRMLMTIFGVAGCTALLVMGFGIRDSISGLATRQFGQILHYDMIAVENEQASSKNQAKLDKMLTSSQFKGTDKIQFEQLTTPNVKNVQTVQLIVPEKTSDFRHFVDLRNRISKQNLALSGHGTVISEKLAKLLKVKVGDKITFDDAQKKSVTVRIDGICELYMGHYLFMNRTTYTKDFKKKFTANADLLRLKKSASSDSKVRQLSADLMATGAVLAISQNNDLKNTINAFLYGINSVMFVLIGCAIMLAVVVIYNLTNINVSERIRELSTIKVLGFYDREVTLYIYRETILLSFLGILAGFGLGAYFHHVIITMLPTDMVMFNPGLTWTNLVLSSLITLATTLALSFMVHAKLKRIDMLGRLSRLIRECKKSVS